MAVGGDFRGANDLKLPKHLERYVVDQDYSRYTPIDQAAWRHIMRQLQNFLSVHAHPVYTDGLRKTGIEVDRIPSIDKMSEKLSQFGWRAVPVSGFLPPAAFMELQSLGVLPIASDMRSVDHLLYTPAPDIVHEAAGHAPILVDPAFAQYLKSYAQVASKAILSRQDMDQYEAIRVLSDLKEDPDSTPEQIKAAEKKLEEVTAAIKELSEAALLGRMNWWTAEYGLIGDLKNPKIFGAGLLSSVGESRSCMKPAVKKIPLTIDCINYSYDITEQQPQLFVVDRFEKLETVLEELANMMAFRIGGLESLRKAERSGTVNTVELDSGLQISGCLKSIIEKGGEAVYLSFQGPTQLSVGGHELQGQGVTQHAEGFGSPIGRAAVEHDGKRSSVFDLSGLPRTELERLGFRAGEIVTLHFESGVVASGKVRDLTFNENKLVIVTLAEARATHAGDLLFDPAWGTYDMAVGTKIRSVFGGPADRSRYGETEDFTKKLVPRRKYSEPTRRLHALFQEVRDLREQPQIDPAQLESLVMQAEQVAPNDWLLHCELLELAENDGHAAMIVYLSAALDGIAKEDPTASKHIADAFKTLHAVS